MNRRRYIAGRLGQMMVTLAILAVLIFYMIRLIPGDPALTMLGIQATPDAVEQLRQSLDTLSDEVSAVAGALESVQAVDPGAVTGEPAAARSTLPERSG